MAKKTIRLALIMFLAFSLVTISFAQGRQTGSIHGIIVDTEANPLPGASITLSGDRVMGKKSYVTSNTGKFRFPALLPGIYDVRVEMPGFKITTRKNLLVSVGKTTEVTITLEMSTVEEEVTVVAETPVVDIETTKIAVHYGSEFIASIPYGRDLYDIQNSVPGAISTENTYRRTSSILGGTVRSSLYALDGVPMNDPATWYQMTNINIDVYEEIEFAIGSLPADIGQTDSVYINIVTKSGGNTFTGALTMYYTVDDFAQDLFSEDEITVLDVNPAGKFSEYKDVSLNFGGPLIKDRIWFFLNGRRQLWGKANPETHDIRIAKIAEQNPGLFTPEELIHYDFDHEEWLAFGKLTFQLSENIKYMGMLHFNDIYEPVYTNRTGSHRSWAYTAIWNHEKDYTTTHQFNWVLDQNTFLDIRGTYVHRYFPINTREEFGANYTVYDKEEDIWWGNSSYNDEYIRKKILGSVSMTRFQDDFLGASHEFKVGAEFEQTEYHRDWYRLGNPWYTYWLDFNKGNPYYYSTSGQRGRLRIRFCPDKKGQWDVIDNTRRFSGFVQDNVTKGRLAINLGLRLDYSFQYEPEQSRPELRYNYAPEFMNPETTALYGPNALLEALIAQEHELGFVTPFDALTVPHKRIVEFLTLSPRVGLAYDLFGNGKTAVKLSFARYYEPVWSAKYNAAQIFGAGTYQWNWYDLNGNTYMDLPPDDKYTIRYRYTQDPDYVYYDEELKSPYLHEFMGGIEHELAKNFKLGLQFVYKVNKDLVEDIDMHNGYEYNATDNIGLIWLPYNFVDPGVDGEFETDDDQSLTAYGLRDDRPAPEYRGTNPPEAKREYTAVILTFDKRMANNWQLKGSVLYSSFKGNAQPTYGDTEGESSLFNSPNSMINSYGRVAYDRPLQIKLMGTYILPYDFIVSAYLQYLSGAAWGRTFDRVYFPPDLPVHEHHDYVFIRAEPRGTRREAPITEMDLRVEKSFSIGDFGKLNVYVDVFNLGGRSGININKDPNARLKYYETPISYKLGSTYGDITSIYGVRSARFGLRFSF